MVNQQPFGGSRASGTNDKAGSFLNLTPLFGLLGAVAFLHERLAPVQLLGAGITLAALMVISGRDATGTR